MQSQTTQLFKISRGSMHPDPLVYLAPSGLVDTRLQRSHAHKNLPKGLYYWPVDYCLTIHWSLFVMRKTGKQKTQPPRVSHPAHKHRSHRTDHQKWRYHTKWNTCTLVLYVSRLEKNNLKFRQRQIIFFQIPTATWVLIKHRHGTF